MCKPALQQLCSVGGKTGLANEIGGGLKPVREEKTKDLEKLNRDKACFQDAWT